MLNGAPAPPRATLRHALEGRIEVYPVRLDDPANGGDAFETATGILTADEFARAARFHRASDGRRWAAVRSRLRRLLGERIGVAPRELVLGASEHGKPYLAEPPSRWRFNVSHSHDRALIALACDLEPGVDIERVRPALDVIALAERVMSGAERAALAALPERAAAEAFFVAWARKEAVLKAIGTGLGHDARRVHVGLGATPRPALDGTAVDGLELIDLPAPAGYRASLCALASERLCGDVDPRLRAADLGDADRVPAGPRPGGRHRE